MISDMELAVRVVRGDLHAFEELIRTHRDQLFRYALYVLPSRQDAEDVVQETFVAAYKIIGRFKGESELKTWLMTIVRRKVADWYRSRKCRENTGYIPEMAEDNTAALTEKIELRLAVAALPQTYRDVVVLRYVNQLDLKEVAVVTGLSVSAVASRLYRAKEILRSTLSLNVKQEVCHDEM